MSYQRSWARRVVVLACSGAVLVCLGAACSSSDSGGTRVKLAEPCTLNSNCVDPLVCTFSRCHTECQSDRDCPGEERCVLGEKSGVCQLPTETACTRDSQCEGEQACGVDGECRDKCKKNSDCVAGDQTCAVSGECDSTLTDKDVVDKNGNILPDHFDDTEGSGGGAGGQSNGSAGDSSGAGKGGAGKGGAGKGGESSEAGDSAVGGAAGEPGLVCPTGTAECGGTDPTDCETNLALPSSCGGCTSVCSADHGTSHCDSDGFKCVVDKCDAGYADCDVDGTTGCESLLATDPKNCGTCGNDCAGGTCKAGVCSAAIVMDPGGATNTTFYEAVLVGNTIVASVLVGSKYELRTVTLPPTDPPSEGTTFHAFAAATNRKDGTLVADADYVYWATNAQPYAVDRKPLNNAAANIQEMFTAPGQINQMKLTLSAFYYFGYQAAGGYGFFSAAKTLGASAMPMPNMQGRYSSIGYMTIAGVAANARLYWPEYNTTNAKYQLFTAPLSGETPALVDADVGNTGYAGAITDGTYAYWNTYAANGKIKRANSGANPTVSADVVVSASYPGYPGNGMIADATYLYFTDNSYNLWRTKKDGSTAPEELLVKGSSTVYMTSMFAVDNTYIYGGGYYGQVVRVRKTPSAKAAP